MDVIDLNPISLLLMLIGNKENVLHLNGSLLIHILSCADMHEKILHINYEC